MCVPTAGKPATRSRLRYGITPIDPSHHANWSDHAGTLDIDARALTLADADAIRTIPNRRNVSAVAPKLIGTTQVGERTVVIPPRAPPAWIPPTASGRCRKGPTPIALIEVTNIGKRYGGTGVPVRALDAVSLSVEEREFVALMGSSGSGKTTLLGIVGAMTPPTAGQVVVDDIDVFRLGAERRADFRREYLGFVFQQLYLMPYLTAAENVMLPLAAAGMANAAQRIRALAALDRVDLADKADRLPHTLSGGEQQRVAIARAVVNEAPVLLADEPTGCLDRRNGERVLALFDRLRAHGLTVFMVTHDSRVAACADRILTLQDGRLVDDQMPQRVRRGAGDLRVAAGSRL